MKTLMFRRRNGKLACLDLSRQGVALTLAAGLLMFGAALLFLGFHLGASQQYSRQVGEADPETLQMRAELDQQRDQVDKALRSAQHDLNALSLQLGKMQARMIRLDALGRRLTNMAQLEKGEFDFEAPPAVGGPEKAEELAPPVVPDFMVSLNEVSRQIEDRGEQLSVLETLLMSRALQEEAVPTGRPITKGWISSYFGMRADPFSGKREHHDGIDFAGKDGAPVQAVAAGVITWAGDRYGYGYLVEINHGNGYVTRYGHNKEIKVELGQKVEKGDLLASMGSTGRSTGPHVHFEVLRHGRPVNPERYIRSARN